MSFHCVGLVSICGQKGIFLTLGEKVETLEPRFFPQSSVDPLLPTIPSETPVLPTVSSGLQFFPQFPVNPPCSQNSQWTPLLPTSLSGTPLYGASSSSPLLFSVGFQTLSLSWLISNLLVSWAVASDVRKGAQVESVLLGMHFPTVPVSARTWLRPWLSQPDLKFSIFVEIRKQADPF